MVSEPPMPHTPPIATPNKPAQHEEHDHVRREGGCESERRVKQHVDHHHGPAPEMIGKPPEEKRADGPHGERQGDRPAQRFDADTEIFGDVGQYQDQQEEIERVERPAEITCGHHVLLLRGPAFQRGKRHSRTPNVV